MTIYKPKLISAIESYLRNEYVGKVTTYYPKNYTIIDVRCEINEADEYCEDDRISYTDFKVQFLVKSPKGKFIRLVNANISY